MFLPFTSTLKLIQHDPAHDVLSVCMMWLAVVVYFIAYFLGSSVRQADDQKQWHRYEVLVQSGQLLQTMVGWLTLMNAHYMNDIATIFNMSTFSLRVCSAASLVFADFLLLRDLYRLDAFFFAKRVPACQPPNLPPQSASLPDNSPYPPVLIRFNYHESTFF